MGFGTFLPSISIKINVVLENSFFFLQHTSLSSLVLTCPLGHFDLVKSFLALSLLF
uniref:Uncharacterized protein n=1 Tax=Rhizophora mucronata TaxID=61149 RepID=A0A2P2PQ01_RHIMU